ncbi:MAG: hypothetical protein CL947_04010 [Epsilonproteobacteria bacterium]|nr:hypothetical protein [Campylobacterota bacterium]|tara:strand:- start:2998 stop:3909 length:912 start_codon:yes stop_codon:yes gene_type:complete
MGTILLYYKYIDIQYPEAIKKWQKELCTKLGLTGRIILAHEGINGTVAGEDEAAESYIKAMNDHPLFNNIDFKKSPGGAEVFPKLKISVKNEIVHLGVDPSKVTTKDGGKHLTPEQTHELLSNPPKDFIILETRNNYESAVGGFAGQLDPNINHFRELPKYIDENLDKFKDKQVLMHCTGGVRCERATAYLAQKNVAKEIFQIEGGIVRYTEKYPDGYFRGKNYVFDKRITVKINDDILGSCYVCNTACDDYFNCLNAQCNKHYISCSNCLEELQNTCSASCKKAIQQRTTTSRKPLEKIKSV